MNLRIGMCAPLMLCVVFAGCSKKADDQAAIRAGIEKRLGSRSDINMSAMDREIKQIAVNGDNATAQVEFRLKGGDARMEIEYTLQRQGKDWVVTQGQPMGGGMGQGMPGSDAGGMPPQGAPSGQ